MGSANKSKFYATYFCERVIRNYCGVSFSFRNCLKIPNCTANIVNFTIFYRSNLVVICTADGRIQPIIVPSTTIPWFQPLVVVCQSRFNVDIVIKEK